MDIEYIKEKIYHTDEKRKIQPGEYLSADVINILRDGNTNDRTACFAPTDIGNPKEPCLFDCEINCSTCNTLTIRSITKTALFDYLKNRKPILCNSCMDSQIRKNQEDKENLKEVQQNRKNQIIKNTDMYIESYLTPNLKWDKELPLYAREQLIINRNDVDYNKVTQAIKSMSYKDFLSTLYWEIISAYKKYKENYKCALCGNNKNLATHHKTYDRHGREHEYIVFKEDLIVLCKDCHSKFHDKL